MGDKAAQSSLQRMVAALRLLLDDRETSVPSEPLDAGPVRGTELYHAVQAVEREYPGGKLPVRAWGVWCNLLLRTDDGKGESDPVERAIAAYGLMERLERWAAKELRKRRPKLKLVAASINARMIDILGKQPEAKDWSKTRWARELDCSPTGIQNSPAWTKIMETREENERRQKARARRPQDG